MKRMKKVMAVLLAALICMGCLMMASAETITTYNVSYSLENGELTFSKNTGSYSLQPEQGNLIPNQLASYSLVRTIVLDESLDAVQGVMKDGNGLTIGEKTVENGDLWAFAIEPVGGLKHGRMSEYIEDVAFPKIIKNRSMKASAITAFSYWLAPNGRKIVSYGEEEAVIGATQEEIAQHERRAVVDINADFGTSFSTMEECRNFLSNMPEKRFYASTHLYCKKGSHQQTVCNNTGMLYILLDDSTSKTDPSTGVKTTFNNGTFGTAAVSIGIRKVKSNKANEVSFSIVPTDENGNKVEPNKAIEISLPIPAGWNASDIQVRHDKDDGTSENLEFVVNDNNALFYTSSCSVFSLVNTAGVSAGEQTDEPDPETPAPEPVTQPSKEDTKPSLNFFQRIIQWFRDLFARLFGI